jgi:subtilase family serine protease
MYDSAEVVERINAEFLKAAARGVTLLAATGDGGSHFSFGAFPEDTGSP